MRRILIVVITLLPSILFAAPVPATLTRLVDSFDEISVGGNFKVTVYVGHSLQVTINAPAKIAQCVLTDTSGPMLYIHRLSSPQCQGTKPIQLTINTPDLSGMMMHGLSNSTVTGIHSRAFMTYSSGESHLTLEGKTDSLNVVISGESTITAQKLSSNSTLVNASGKTQTTVNAADVLYVQAAGSAHIDYFNTPRKIVKSLRGSSTLIANP